MTIKKTILLLVALSFVLFAAGCGKDAQNQTASNTAAPKTTYVVGTTALFQDILVAAKPDFEKSGCKLEIKVFDDAISPNVALKEGSIDATFHQNAPYLVEYNRERGTDLAQYEKGLVTTFYGLYSNKIKNLSELKDGGKISVPNDASNRVRALKMLEKLGLIKLKAGVALPTVLDIVENPKKLEIVEMDGWSIVNTLADVDCGATSSSVAVKAKIDPKTAIAQDGSQETGEYAMILVVTKEKYGDNLTKQLYESLRTETVKKALVEKYQGGIVPLF
ncbi:MAG: MetQ/NlpA family ABC transporter substrate-binding protein [Syntrophomonas sp.]